MCAEICVKVRIKGREEVLPFKEALSLFECLQRELEKAKTDLSSVEFKRPTILVEAKRELKKTAVSRHGPTLEASRRKTILELLDKREAHIEEIADAVGLAKDTVYPILNRLIKEGAVARVERGVYAKAKPIEAGEKQPAPKPAAEPPTPQPATPQPTALKPQPAGPPSSAPPLEKKPEARSFKLPPDVEKDLFRVPEEVKKLLERKMRERV